MEGQRLIRIGPEMLTALKDGVSLIDGITAELECVLSVSAREIYNRMVDAIAKAEGRS
jgi:hypothetical protein